MSILSKKPPILSLFFSLFTLFLINIEVSAQYTIKGKVLDQKTQQPLAFVNLLLNNDPYTGGNTDINGEFYLESKDAIQYITLSYVGYQSKTIYPKDSQYIEIKLQESNLNLNEIVVVAGENPAYRIIRKAIKNRPKNNPERFSSFRYKAYNKIRLLDNKIHPDLADTLDIKNRIGMYQMMMETVTERKFMAPDLDEEKILAMRVSGFKDPFFAPWATVFQPFSFYKEVLTIIDKEFLNPLCNGCTNEYEYRLEDTLYQDQDSIFLIYFFPRKGKNFDGLKGTLYIHTKGYAIKNVLATPAKQSLVHLKIEQQYELVDGQWFPSQMNFEMDTKFKKKDPILVQGKSFLKDIEISPPLKRKDFGAHTVLVDPKAAKRDSSFWDSYRLEELSNKEKLSYQILDSLGKRRHLDFWVGAVRDLPMGRVALGPVAFDPFQIMDFNGFEKFRLGFGLYTSSKLSKKIIVGGYFGYGFGDKKWKYGGEITVTPWLNKDFNMQISYLNDAREAAKIYPRRHSLGERTTPHQGFFTRYVLDKMDYIQELELSAHFRLFHHLQIRPFVNASLRKPGYDYVFEHNNEQYSEFYFVHTGIQLRFAYNEKKMQSGSYQQPIKNDFPILFLTYEHGWKGIWKGEYEYNKLTLGIQSRFFIKNLGRTDIFLKAGWIDADVPYPVLFNGGGSFSRSRIFIVDHTFQTVRTNEFLADKFVYLFLSHNFETLIFKIGKFQPQFKLIQGIGFGWLDAPEKHQQFDSKVMDKGFFESGLMIENLLKHRVRNVFYMGLGVGMFYRYGAYHLPKLWDNFAYKIALTASF